MQQQYDGDDGTKYLVRHVPLEEALKLRAEGVVFYDNTKLVAMNTCPTYGVLRYALHKTETSIAGRNLALECGKACHDFFAAIRMWSLIERTNNPGDLMVDADKVMDHGVKLFGHDRFDSMMQQPQDGDRQSNAINFALDALHTSGFYNDPYDKRRTMENMEVACITYADRYFKSELPVYVEGDFIGVEVPFVVEVRMQSGFHYKNGDEAYLEDKTHYYCGRIDGVHGDANHILGGENKTAGRINDVWRTGFHMSTQVTGYNIALSAMLGRNVEDSLIMGTQIPVPARDIYSGISFEPVRRTLSDKVRWFEWFFHSISMYEQYASSPTYAPRYTHSCNRYFNICQFLPFCTMERREQQEALDMMRVEEWSPLDHVTAAAAEPVGE